MQRRYSRQTRTEQRKDARSAAFYIVLTVAALILILFFGIPAIGRVAVFLHDLQSSGKPIDTGNDNTPPAPPIFERLPQTTNKTVLAVYGRTEAGAIVTLKINDNEEEVVADNGGAFTYDWELLDGDNKIKAFAKDSAGNQSQETQTFTVKYDDEAPELEIKSPKNGQSFSGTKARQATIEGSTEARASVTINDRIVAVDTEGNFSFFTSLKDGENVFIIKSKDAGGNEVEKSITVDYTP